MQHMKFRPGIKPHVNEARRSQRELEPTEISTMRLAGGAAAVYLCLERSAPTRSDDSPSPSFVFFYLAVRAEGTMFRCVVHPLKCGAEYRISSSISRTRASGRIQMSQHLYFI